MQTKISHVSLHIQIHMKNQVSCEMSVCDSSKFPSDTDKRVSGISPSHGWGQEANGIFRYNLRRKLIILFQSIQAKKKNAQGT